LAAQSLTRQSKFVSDGRRPRLTRSGETLNELKCV
jgi:hypothetical protein